jgi:hypothetical protein
MVIRHTGSKFCPALRAHPAHLGKIATNGARTTARASNDNPNTATKAGPSVSRSSETRPIWPAVQSSYEVLFLTFTLRRTTS